MHERLDRLSSKAGYRQAVDSVSSMTGYKQAK